jgi:hypothetical protein
MDWFKNYKYKNLTFLFLSIFFTIILSKVDLFGKILFNLGHFEIIGPFVAGFLYISTSTAALGILIFSDLSKTLSPIQIGIVGGIGASIADFALFSFVRGGLISEITTIYYKFGGKHITKIMYHKYFRWSLPIIGAIIIASPLPDEIGVGLMGFTKIKNYQFVLMCLALDITGVFLLSLTFSLIK